MADKRCMERCLKEHTVVIERTRYTKRRGRYGILFVGRDTKTGKEVRWWM